MLNRYGLAVSVVASLALPQYCLARPLVPAEKRIIPYHADLPPCDDKAVLDRLSSRFAAKESDYWHSDLQIVSYDRIGAYGYRSNGADYIPRRYCSARAWLNNGKRHWTVYTIGEELGIIGFGFGLADYKFGLEWCVEGLDRGWAYGPGCQALRPIAQRLKRGEAAQYRWRAPVAGALPKLSVTPIKPLPAPALPSTTSSPSTPLSLPPPIPAPVAPLPPPATTTP